jgi:hypothetical protein
MTRKKTQPVSWLNTIQNARAAFTGEARLLEDKWIPATETTFRGVGYRLTVEITPRQSLFGALPEVTVNLQGTTKRAPDQRLNPGTPHFPPDALRQELYWEYARSDITQPVLVLLADSARVCPLTGSSDDLPDTVILIHQWTKITRDKQRSAVLADLRKPNRNPVAYVAGFELLLKMTSNLTELVDSFLSLPKRPGVATQEVLNQLYAVAMSLPQTEVYVLAQQLLVHLAKEVEPAAIVGYLTWFDAHRRVWSDNPKLKAVVVAEAERAINLSFSGSDAPAWKQRVQQQAAFLLPTGQQ